MDEDVIQEPQKAPAAPTEDGDQDASPASEKVFEITADLNMAPVKDTDDDNSADYSKISAEKKAEIDNIAKNIDAQINRVGTPSAPVAQTITEPKPVQPAAPTSNTPDPVNNNTQAQEAVMPTHFSAPATSTQTNTPPQTNTQNTQNSTIQNFTKQPSGLSSNIPQSGTATPIPNMSMGHSIPLNDIKEAIAQAAAAKGNPATTPTNIAPTVPKQDFTNKTGIPKPSQFATPLKPIRTFESDVAEVMSHRRTSAASIAIAESVKKEGVTKIGNTIQNKETSHAFRNLAFIMISILLIGGGLGAAYYLYMKSPVAPVQKPTTTTTPTAAETGIIKSDSKITLSIDGMNGNTILSKLKLEIAKPVDKNKIKEIIPTKTIASKTEKVSSTEMVDLLGIQTPDMIKRSLDPKWMLGVYGTKNGSNAVFVIATNNFFQNAFAGMLNWEQTMADDLRSVIAPQIINNTDTASGTKKSNFTTRGQFNDRIKLNRDVREYITEDGTILFIYSFIDSDKLLITGDESVLQEVMSRLEPQYFLR